MRVVIISQARMTSTRFPGKIMKEILGKPLLQYQIERLRRVSDAAEVVIATTTNDEDDVVEDLCTKLNCAIFRGAEYDVLARYYHAAKIHNAKVLVRVTSDCPLIDPFVVEKVIQCYLSHSDQYDYVSNTLIRTYPRGMDSEVFPFHVLEEIFSAATSYYEREHVTPFIHMHREHFRTMNVAYHKDVSHHRWTIDTHEDFELIRKIFEALIPLYPAFTLEDMLRLMEQHPEWSFINQHVIQKSLDS